MKNEDILKAAQNQSPKEGEFENKIQSRGAFLAAGVGLIITAIMFYVEFLLLHKLDYGKPAIILAVSSASDLFVGIRLKEKKKIVIGSICLLLFVLCVIMYVGALMK